VYESRLPTWIAAVKLSPIRCATDGLASVSCAVGGTGLSVCAPSGGTVGTGICPVAIACGAVDDDQPGANVELAGGGVFWLAMVVNASRDQPGPPADLGPTAAAGPQSVGVGPDDTLPPSRGLETRGWRASNRRRPSTSASPSSKRRTPEASAARAPRAAQRARDDAA